MSSISFPAQIREYFLAHSIEITDKVVLTKILQDSLVKKAFIAWANIHPSIVEHTPRLYQVLDLAMDSDVEWAGMARYINSLYQWYSNDGSAVLINKLLNNPKFRIEAFPDKYDATILELYESGIINSDQIAKLFFKKYPFTNDSDFIEEALPFLEKLDSTALFKILSHKSRDKIILSNMVLKDKNSDKVILFHAHLKEAIPLLDKLDPKDLAKLVSLKNEWGHMPLHNADNFKNNFSQFNKLSSKTLMILFSKKRGNPFSFNSPDLTETALVYRLFKKLSPKEKFTYFSTEDENGIPLIFRFYLREKPTMSLKELEPKDLFDLFSLKNGNGQPLLHDPRAFVLIPYLKELNPKDLFTLLSTRDIHGLQIPFLSTFYTNLKIDYEAIIPLLLKLDSKDLFSLLFTPDAICRTPLFSSNSFIHPIPFEYAIQLLDKLNSEDLFALFCKDDEEGHTFFQKMLLRAIPFVNMLGQTFSLLNKLDPKEQFAILCNKDKNGQTLFNNKNLSKYNIQILEIISPILKKLKQDEFDTILEMLNLFKDIETFHKAIPILKKNLGVKPGDFMDGLYERNIISEHHILRILSDDKIDIKYIIDTFDLAIKKKHYNLVNKYIEICSSFEDIAKLILNEYDINTLPPEVKINLLPILSPDVISYIALLVNPNLLNVEMRLDNASISTPERLLNAIKNQLGQLGKTDEETDADYVQRNSMQILSAVKYLEKIPLKALLAVSQNENLASIATYYYEAFSVSQQKVIIPSLSLQNSTTIMCNEWNTKEHSSSICNATGNQKIYMLNSGRLKLENPLLKSFKTYKIEFDLNEINVRNLIGKQEAKETYQKLKDGFEVFDIQNRMAIEKFLIQKITSLHHQLLGSNPSENLQDAMVDVDALFQEIQNAGISFKNMRSTIIELDGKVQLEEQVRIPDNFYDPITYAVMINPVKAEDGYVYERESIEKWIAENGLSPMSRQPLSKDNLIPQDALKAEIEEFRKAHPDHPDLITTKEI